jgi:DNA polymerase I-like protein with 3'-5' exonuclease and polymerase domains
LFGVTALDLECYDPLLKTHGPGWCFPTKPGHVCGVSIANDAVENYWPIGHSEQNLPVKQVTAWLKRELELDPAPDLLLVLYNSTYDLGWLRRMGIRPTCPIVDVAVAVPLIDENRFSYGLDDVGKDWLGEVKDYGLMMDAAKRGLSLSKTANKASVMGRMNELPSWAVAGYAIQDAKLTRRLWLEKCKAQIDLEDLHQVFKLEHDLIPVLLDMREHGVRINVGRAHRLSLQYELQKQELLKQIKYLTGRTLALWEGEDVSRAFKSVGINWTEVTAKGEASFRSTVMERLDHPLAKLIVKARRIDKAKGTFIDGHMLGHEVNGRIHAVFSALRSDEGGAVTGRSSSSNPNLQNLPSREEDISSDIRGLMEPDSPEEAWASSDFASQEPRLGIHFAQAAGIPGVKPFVDAYHENPNLDFHQKGADITGLKRKDAKNLTLGKMYSMGGAKLCHSLGLPTEWVEKKDGSGKVEVAGPEGQAIMDQYDRYMPFIRGINDMCMRKAEQRGWIRTLLGRRRHFQQQSKNAVKGERGAYPYKALNCLIQGSAADMTKKAMIDLWKAGIKILVSVHDEIGFSARNAHEAEEGRRLMCECVKLNVPVEADLEIGPNWGSVWTWNGDKGYFPKFKYSIKKST